MQKIEPSLDSFREGGDRVEIEGSGGGGGEEGRAG